MQRMIRLPRAGCAAARCAGVASPATPRVWPAAAACGVSSVASRCVPLLHARRAHVPSLAVCTVRPQARAGAASAPHSTPRCTLPAASWRSFSKKRGGSKKKGGGGGGKNRAPQARGGGGGQKAPEVEVNQRGYGIEGDVLFRLRHLNKTLPGNRPLLTNVSLDCLRGAKVGVLGLNGSGKSTLMKIIAGIEKDVDGEVWRKDNIKFGYLEQEPELDPEKDVRGNIMDGLKEKTDLLARFNDISMAMAEPDADFDKLLAEQSQVQMKIDELDCWNLEHLIDMASTALRCPPGDSSVVGLSGGEKRRVALCRLLLEAPDVLLLDEPTNHLDAESVSWLEGFLLDYKGTVIAITHDRYFLDNVAAWILELDRGHTYIYRGNYSVWLDQRQQRMDMQKKSDVAKAKALQEELAWIRQGVKGRQAKSKARMRKFKESSDDLDRDRAANAFLSGKIAIPPGPRLGDQVIEFDKVSYSIGGRTIIKKLSFSLEQGAIVGVVGPNGAGKSTLLGIIDGMLKPDSGTVKLGETVRLGHVSQSRHDLSPNNSVFQEISENADFVDVGDKQVPVRTYMAGFNLVGNVQQKPVSSLSGGERGRVHLAKVLKASPNVLLLDEPTNDLDIDTLRSLEDAVQHFDGCAVVVSHDRYFLDRVCTHTIAFEADGKVVYFDGNYAEYEEYKVNVLGQDVDDSFQHNKFKM